MFRTFCRGLTDLIYPARCILCKTDLHHLEKTHQLCFACLSELQINRPVFCRRCSRPLDHPSHHICKNCQNFESDLDQAWGAFLFNDPMQKLLHLYKYGHKTHLRHFFADRIFRFLTDFHISLNEYDLMMPIPLHPARLRERGYNQSRLIADILAADFQIPLDAQSLIRIKHTPHQARLSQKDRWTNIEGAFKIKPHNTLRQKKIILVDDLYTTGATVSQAAKILKSAGAKRVIALTTAIANFDK